MEQNKCNKCGRPMQYATEPKCNYCDACMSEYCGCKLGRIKEIEPTCDSTAVIPSITVESVEGITNLANCLVHVNDINTTFYVDDKHRVMITWAGPVDIPGYDMKNNPNGYRDQIVTDIEKGIAVIYDKHGKGFTFGIEQNYNVQQTINNKLDEMAASGELEEIIAVYLNSNALIGFDTVTDMKASTALVDGSYAKTLGYYAKDDYGEATYKIRAKADGDTVDEMLLLSMSDDSLVAELVLTEEMNVRQFGAKGDGVSNDTTIIQKVFNTCNNIFIPPGTYMIDGSTPLIPNNNNKIVLDNNATLKVITNNLQTYRAIHIINKNNIEISGGTIEGDKNTHTGTAGEWGAGIRVYGNSTNIYIHDITIKNTWGDGLTVATTGNVRTERVHVDNARRNGFSIVSAGEFVSTDDFIENTSGTNPQAGVDIEPDTTNNLLSKVVFNNLYTKNNTHTGLAIAIGKALNEKVSIYISNHKDSGSAVGESCSKDKDLVGNIVIKDSCLEDNLESGIRLWRCFDGDCAVKIIRPYIYNCNKNSVGTTYGAGIAGYVLNTDSDSPLGNIEIVEPYIHNYDSSIANAIFFTHAGSADPAFNNIKIINPIYIQGKHIYSGGRIDNMTFTDIYNVTQYAANISYTLQRGQYYSLYTNTSATTANRTLTIPDTMWIGRKIKVRNMNSTYNYSLKLPTTDYCYQLSNTVSPKITLNKLGDTIEIEKIGATEWIITEINCTPTVS